MGGMRQIGDAGHALMAEARSAIWAVRPEFWTGFSHLLARDRLAISMELAEPERSAARRSRGTSKRVGVGMIPLRGLITPRPSILSMLFGGGGGLVAFREQLREAVNDPDLDAIVLDIDSPGGSVALVEEAAAEIRAAREVKPIVASANVDAGSAAYWLAAQASEIAVTPSGMVGSVGVYVMHTDFSGMNEKMGIEPTFISAGRFKTEGNPEEPLTDEAAAHLQSVVDETYATFVRDVAAGRGVSDKAVRKGFGEGRMLTAPRALAAGAVDRVETVEATVSRLLGGDLPDNRTARADSSERASSLVTDEAADEAHRASSSRKSLKDEDEALADSVYASLS